MVYCVFVAIWRLDEAVKSSSNYRRVGIRDFTTSVPDMPDTRRARGNIFKLRTYSTTQYDKGTVPHQQRLQYQHPLYMK